MSKKNYDALLGEIKRLHRQFPKEEVPEKIVSYVKERYFPKTELTTRNRKLRTVSPSEVWEVVLNYYRAQRKDVVGRRRFGQYAKARRAVIYLLLLRTPLTVTQIGRLFKRDHSTITHSKKRLLLLMEKEDKVRGEIELLNKRL